MENELTEVSVKPVDELVDTILEAIEDEEDFATLALFRISRLNIMKQAIKKLSDAVDAKLIEISGITGDKKFETENYTVTVGQKTIKKVPLDTGIHQILTVARPVEVVGLLSTNAIKQGAYGKFCIEKELDCLTEEVIENKVVVKEINKNFIK